MTWPFVISIPHCGYKIPDSVFRMMRLTKDEVMESVDLGTKEIFGSLPVKSTIMAEWSRLLVDLNRAPSDTNEKGVVALKDYHGREIYKENIVIDWKEISSRVANYYFPYHKQLEEAIESPGIIGLFDCHSLEPFGPPSAPDAGQKRPDIVLGNNGARDPQEEKSTITCPSHILEPIIRTLESEGFSVSLNYPYSGGYITAHYGARMREKGGFALQIEINQGLYIKEDKKEADPSLITEIRAKFRRIFEKIAIVLK